MKQILPLLLISNILHLSLLCGSENRNFEQITTLLPTPGENRLATGAPGPAYWQQEANYKIKVELDEKRSRIQGSETIEYVNHSPHTLNYLWVQLDQNALAQGSKRQRSIQSLKMEPVDSKPAEIEYESFRGFLYNQQFEGGYDLRSVQDLKGNDLQYTVVNTNMRVDLKKPLRSGESFSFNIEWAFTIQDDSMSFRHGKRKLKSDEYTYHVAQWYPRMCAYYDQEGWQTKPYIGNGEFALEFGSFEVEITVPADYIVAATGQLANANQVLSSTIRDRLDRARTSSKVIEIITSDEAAEKIGKKENGTKTWNFKAEQVRDFAWAASRAYIWDAMGVDIDGSKVMTMSVYPDEAIPLWKRFSTEAVAQAIRVYSESVYPYPYPVAWSTWGAEGGMEYPMISFQTTKEIDDKETYPAGHRSYVIGVIIHEVGHNWFPMIINNDERQWQWMDEGLNSFMDFRAGNLMDPVLQKSNLLNDRRTIRTMTGENDPIIMTAADNQTSRGFQAYSKPSLGLLLLRESILGHDLFDFAFKEYARRWAFKRPTPADFFRTMEDASGVDLDWFWRGWFYGNDHVDMEIDEVNLYRLDDGEPRSSKALDEAEEEAIPDTPYELFLKDVGTLADKQTHLQDWYYSYDPYEPTEQELAAYKKTSEKLEDWQKELLEFADLAYVISVKNTGGMIMPLVFDIEFKKGASRRLQVPVEVWRFGDKIVKIPFLTDREVVKVTLDKDNTFADANLDNNVFPQEIEEGRFKLKPTKPPANPMQKALFPDSEKEEDKKE
ncbi:MAG: M1 family metallopeptidase [Verrucomicrobia bacterium]|nr:M1 family metallopeptidase [Verrucomicrobiota bacterium]MDA1065731.1 M1 family metallopeptidase [Verrucomicrobiota bacterium]